MRFYKSSCIICFCLIFGFCNGSSRKYDIEAESQKLYGEDLQSVLKRFRKTPEYLSILETKLNDLKTDMNYMATNIQTYYEDKMSEKIEEFLRPNHTVVDDIKQKFMRVRYTPLRRQANPGIVSPNITGVEKLDTYKKLRSALTVDERNHFKDVGYEFAGHIIHAMINAVSGDDVLHQSTLLPYGSDEDKNDPNTAHEHKVTHDSTNADDSRTTLNAHELHTHPPDYFRNLPQHNSL